ncbi:hypothetical protein RQP46_007177 [Phenoliferia psychrophenolica]
MGKLTFPSFVSAQFRTLPNPEKTNLAGRVVIVTGSNVGLGLEAARHFAAMGPAKLILAVRTTEKGEAAKKSIVESTKCGADVIEVWELDMSSFASVKAFAKKAEGLARLDIVNENAGIATDQWSVTKDGYESTLQVNDIGTGLLAVLLLPILKRTAALPPPPGATPLKVHLTLTGSEVHFWSTFTQHADPHPITALNDAAHFDGKDRYNVSKLLNVFLARKLAAAAGDDVVVNVVNPGLCHSELTRSAKGLVAVFMTVFKALLARTTEVGSRNLVWACLNETPPGAYVSNCEVTEESDFALSPEGRSAEERVWADLTAIWEKEAPETASILA